MVRLAIAIVVGMARVAAADFSLPPEMPQVKLAHVYGEISKVTGVSLDLFNPDPHVQYKLEIRRAHLPPYIADLDFDGLHATRCDVGELTASEANEIEVWAIDREGRQSAHGLVMGQLEHGKRCPAPSLATHMLGPFELWQLALLVVVGALTIYEARRRIRRHVDPTAATIPSIALDKLLRDARTRDILWFIASVGALAYLAMDIGQWAAVFAVLVAFRGWDFVLSLLALNLAKRADATARAAGDCLAISAADDTVTIFVSPKAVKRAAAHGIPTMKVQ
ncbi:MAG: hypothetical protein QM831_23785 [Kofleriaceae bacterium]